MLRILLVLLITAACLSTGCSDDPATPIVPRPTQITVDLPAVTTAFTGVMAQARHPAAAVSGPFVLRGYNKHYDYSLSAMVMSLEITNDGEVPYGGPVSLAFLRLLPEGVVLLGQATGQPVLEFEFGDEDGIWSPDESSLPLTIAVGITPDVRFSFTAELAVGFGPDSGMISGTVWRDSDGNGERDPGEPGAGGLAIDLLIGAGDDSLFPAVRRTRADENGRYSFGGLQAGIYRLQVETRPYLTPTTATDVEVTLVAGDLNVAPVDTVDFGFNVLPVDTLTLAAAADAMIRADVSSRMNDNHGADPYLGVGTTRTTPGPFDAIRGLVRFDLDLVGRPVLAAYLELTVAQFRDGGNQTYQLDVNAIVESGDRTPWIEGNGTEVGPPPPGVVWVDQANGVAWIGQGDGGDANNQSQPDFNPTAAATATVVQTAHASGDVISWDVTDLVNSWLDGTTPNHGVVVHDVNPGGSFRQLWFWSRDGLLREYDISGVRPGPRLVLMYE